MHKILLYYKYTNIENPEDLQEKQKELCKRLDIKGRILVSPEGINGTVGGEQKSVEEYMKTTNEYPGLEDMEWKISEGPVNSFPKLRVVIREEIVTLGLKRKDMDVNLAHKAEYIEPEELKKMYERKEDFVIIDGRNEYEGRVGKFKNAIVPNIKAFREFPKFVKTIEHLKDKQIITYCTGGIRCEKASTYLKEQGFKKVKQLHGGIHRYSDLTGGENFEGEMYVFDNRVTTKVNHVNPTVIGNCHHCETKVSRFINCKNAECNQQIICCEKCEDSYKGCCSKKCIKKASLKVKN